MSLKETLKSSHLNKILIILAMMVVLVFVFSTGVFVGQEKAKFSRAWGENYYGNIMGPNQRGLRGFMDFGRPGFNAHSGLGQIIRIEGNGLIIKGLDNVEKTIAVDDKTAIQKFRQSLKISDLKVDEFVVVIGRPNNQGQIEARLIRVMPAPRFNKFRV